MVERILLYKVWLSEYC